MTEQRRDEGLKPTGPRIAGSDYGDRMRRRQRLGQFGRALFMILMVAGLAFGAQRSCQRFRGGRPPAAQR